MPETRTALVAGANGIIGKALMETLATAPGWRARALSRRPHGSPEAIVVDLTDAGATRAALTGARDTTHLFYAALAPQPSLAEEVAVNGAMLRHLLDGLEAVGAPLARVVLYQGAKVYGVHLGPVPSPFYEDDPRHIGPNFYFTQEDELRARAARGGPDFAILRPDVVVGDAAGNAMNIAMVIGAYAALCRAEGAAFRFPGPAHVYDGVLAQVTEAGALARASLWAATAEAARGEAFNYVHEPFRWRRAWERLASALDLPPGPPVPLRLATHMADKEAAWARLVAGQGLVDTPYARAVGWGFGDFVFHSDFDLVSDMGKIRRAGFTETVDSVAALIGAIRRLREARVLPR
ncbi:SDR family oxidoreductase [Methylobacterium nonmethylotrophicum]|uniref:SDR family oxidoreductase n=1 Tax=Methylobacterium nonmethylotrophicum TaxID=1141884 RepID=A0A4Z0NEN4_9HYPH|nr:SDR family oxidoreductase [Methylobacterium nonmethylotrophicum]TGD93291.1 SDR family oxidoreductase [Methylobacterium nonmethylotrophicum]